MTDYSVLDVEGYDRRFATVQPDPCGPLDPTFIVDRETLGVYGFGVADRDWVGRAASLHLAEGYRLAPEPEGDPRREAILAAVEAHDLPTELREEVPIEQPLTLRERLSDYLARFLAWIRS